MMFYFNKCRNMKFEVGDIVKVEVNLSIIYNMTFTSVFFLMNSLKCYYNYYIHNISL